LPTKEGIASGRRSAAITAEIFADAAAAVEYALKREIP
jgi:hypothetical protein